MGLITPLLCLIAVVSLFLLLLRILLQPIIPVKGKTNVPGPGGIRWPIIGDGLWFVQARDLKGIWDVLTRLGRARKDITSVYLGSKLMIMVQDPILVKKIIKTNKCQRKDPDFYRAFSYLSDGVFPTTNLTRWAYLRHPLDRILHPKNMDKFKTIFAEKGKMACDKVQRICDQGVFNMMDIIKYYMIDSTFEIFCDVPVNQQLENTLNLTEYFERGIKCALVRLYNPLNKIEWLFQATALGKESRAVLNEGRPIMSKMVDDCMKKMEDRGYSPTEKDFEPQNYIEAAIHTGFMENASREKTVFSFSDLIIAGYDTTGVATASTILYLAMHPEYQEKAYQEQFSLLGNSLEEPTRTELSRMEYLEMAFNESLRKISIPAILRVLSSQIEVDGYILPEGAALYFNYNGITNDPRYYERPDDYYPDHFLPEKVAERPECAFMPFSFGSRACPGRRLAMLSSKFILSMLLRRFKFTSPLQYEDLQYKLMIMVETVQGYPVIATPRTIAASS